MNNKILVTRSSMPPFDEYINEIKELWDTHWITNMGVKHKELQKMLEDFFGIKHVTLYTNGHLALENALEILNFLNGSEIITTPYTFASTTHAIVRKGLVPVFCDINDIDFTIDVEKIESLITDKTVAIMPVHVYGNMCDVDKISQIASKYKLKVIYDAAHAFAVNYKGKSSACYGDISMFSFHATKVFNTIEGGALCYNDDSLVQVLDDNKNFGIRNEEYVGYVGGNAKMNEFQAAMGICNLRHLRKEIEKRRKVAHKYVELLDGINGIKINRMFVNDYYNIQSDLEPNYAYFPVIFDGYKYNRDEVYDRLYKENIVSRKYFYPITNSFDCYRKYRIADVNKTPIAFDISNKVLTLPIYADLELDVVEKICNIILKK